MFNVRGSTVLVWLLLLIAVLFATLLLVGLLSMRAVPAAVMVADLLRY